MIVLGVDPGAITGLAWYVNGVLEVVDSDQVSLKLLYTKIVGVGLIVMEDSRMQTTFPRQSSARGMLKIARNVGEIDAYCRLIEAECNRLSIPCISVSPKDKGAKLTSAQFAEITGWTGRTNQHERDAAMVAYRFRHGVK